MLYNMQKQKKNINGESSPTAELFSAGKTPGKIQEKFFVEGSPNDANSGPSLVCHPINAIRSNTVTFCLASRIPRYCTPFASRESFSNAPCPISAEGTMQRNPRQIDASKSEVLVGKRAEAAESKKVAQLEEKLETVTIDKPVKCMPSNNLDNTPEQTFRSKIPRPRFSTQKYQNTKRNIQLRRVNFYANGVVAEDKSNSEADSETSVATEGGNAAQSGSATIWKVHTTSANYAANPRKPTYLNSDNETTKHSVAVSRIPRFFTPSCSRGPCANPLENATIDIGKKEGRIVGEAAIGCGRTTEPQLTSQGNSIQNKTLTSKIPRMQLWKQPTYKNHDESLGDDEDIVINAVGMKVPVEGKGTNAAEATAAKASVKVGESKIPRPPLFTISSCNSAHNMTATRRNLGNCKEPNEHKNLESRDSEKREIPGKDANTNATELAAKIADATPPSTGLFNSRHLVHNTTAQRSKSKIPRLTSSTSSFSQYSSAASSVSSVSSERKAKTVAKSEAATEIDAFNHNKCKGVGQLKGTLDGDSMMTSTVRRLGSRIPHALVWRSSVSSVSYYSSAASSVSGASLEVGGASSVSGSSLEVGGEGKLADIEIVVEDKDELESAAAVSNDDVDIVQTKVPDQDMVTVTTETSDDNKDNDNKALTPLTDRPFLQQLPVVQKSANCNHRIFLSVIMHLWRKRRSEAKNLMGEVNNLNHIAIKNKTQMFVFKALFRREQIRHNELSNRLKNTLEDIKRTKTSYENFTKTLVRLQSDKALLEQEVKIKEEELEACNTAHMMTKSDLFRAMAMQRKLQMSLCNEQRKVQSLQMEKEQLLQETYEFNAKAQQNEEMLRAKLNERIDELEQARKRIHELEVEQEQLREKTKNLNACLESEAKLKEKIQYLQNDIKSLENCVASTSMGNRLKAAWEVLRWIAHCTLPALNVE